MLPRNFKINAHNNINVSALIVFASGKAHLLKNRTYSQHEITHKTTMIRWSGMYFHKPGSGLNLNVKGSSITLGGMDADAPAMELNNLT